MGDCMYTSEEVGLDCTLKYCREKVNLEEEKYKPDNDLLEAAIKNILDDIEKYEGNVLFIVNCTKTKAWSNNNDESKDEYIRAGCAYCGSTFVRFKYFLAELEKRLGEKNISHPIYWVILSAKYGFIEPDHPIHNYNVAFNYEETGPISILSLIRQAAYQKRRWRISCKGDGEGSRCAPSIKKLIDFDKVYVYTNNIYYLLAVASIFGAKARRLWLLVSMAYHRPLSV